MEVMAQVGRSTGLSDNVELNVWRLIFAVLLNGEPTGAALIVLPCDSHLIRGVIRRAVYEGELHHHRMKVVHLFGDSEFIDGSVLRMGVSRERISVPHGSHGDQTIAEIPRSNSNSNPFRTTNVIGESVILFHQALLVIGSCTNDNEPDGEGCRAN